MQESTTAVGRPPPASSRQRLERAERAVDPARERGREERGITAPEMVVPESAHAAFHKGSHYFGVKLHKIKVRPDWRADCQDLAIRR